MAQKDICIIGAGAAGLAALKAVLDSSQYRKGLWRPTVFEARDKIGGVWVPAEPVRDPPLTPLYDCLTTNLPHPVMAYTSFSFPPSTYLFPKAKTVENYLDSYTQEFDLNRHIHLNTTILSVTRAELCWKVLVSERPEPLEFDLLMVCNGHYNKPRFPSIPGLDSWLRDHRATHSAWYRSPEKYSSQVVIVIGAGPSGQDISADLSTVASRVIHSVNGATASHTGNLTIKGRVARFCPPNGVVEFEDGSTECIDYCILATGYEMSFPFLPDSILSKGNPEQPSSDAPLPRSLCNTTFSVYPLARHLFPLFQDQYPPQTLAFLGLLYKVAPLPLLEVQANAALHFFANPDSLDVVQEKNFILDRYIDFAKQGKSPAEIWKAWDKFAEMDQFDYRDKLSRFASSPVVVQDWEKEMYAHKVSLRKLWVELENSGEADDMVRGVGTNGNDEWVELMRRMLRMVEERGLVDSTIGPAT